MSPAELARGGLEAAGNIVERTLEVGPRGATRSRSGRNSEFTLIRVSTGSRARRRRPRLRDGTDAYGSTLAKLRRAFEKAGLSFIDGNGEGPGVRFKKSLVSAAPASRMIDHPMAYSRAN